MGLPGCLKRVIQCNGLRAHTLWPRGVPSHPVLYLPTSVLQRYGRSRLHSDAREEYPLCSLPGRVIPPEQEVAGTGPFRHSDAFKVDSRSAGPKTWGVPRLPHQALGCPDPASTTSSICKQVLLSQDTYWASNAVV